MAYKIVIKESVYKDLKGIDKTQGRRIFDAIDKNLTESPRKVGDPLKGKFKGLWRIYVVPYRIIYSINDRDGTVSIEKIGHRKDVYR